MTECNGDAEAISPTEDFRLWQINGSHGAATLDPLDNARATS